MGTSTESRTETSSLIVSRSPRDLDEGKMSWLVFADDRGLDQRDCGCGEMVLQRTVLTSPSRPKPALIMVTFWHEGPTWCMAAFDAKDFHPLKYQEYCKLLGIDADYEADEE